MFGMFCLIIGIDQGIIDKNHYEFVKISHEYKVHEIHEIGWDITETKRHHQILVETISGGESGFGNVAWSNLNLMITRLKIDLEENLDSSQLIEKNINVGKRIFVFNGHHIERSVVHT
jgi:hypothetical protein